MSSVIVNQIDREHLIPMNNMQPGDYGIIIKSIIDKYVGSVVFHTGEKVIIVGENPERTCWRDWHYQKNHLIDILETGDEIIITI